MNSIEEIKKLEEELRLAMLAGDLSKLEALLSDRLIFTDHSGLVYTKEMDLGNHRSGNLKIDSLYPEDQKIVLYEGSAIVSVLMRIAGSFTGQPFSALSRYTRVWVKHNGHWIIAAAHSGILKDSE